MLGTNSSIHAEQDTYDLEEADCQKPDPIVIGSSQMRIPGKNWFRTARRRLLRPSTKETIVLLHNATTNRSFYNEATATTSRRHGPGFSITKQEFAAIHIQACFRGHLARRAYRALRSLVKLQAIVRGVCVRRQARIALQCMHALARLQVTIRARQLLMN